MYCYLIIERKLHRSSRLFKTAGMLERKTRGAAYVDIRKASTQVLVKRFPENLKMAIVPRLLYVELSLIDVIYEDVQKKRSVSKSSNQACTTLRS